MNTTLLEKNFKRMGANVDIHVAPHDLHSVNVLENRKESRFVVTVPDLDDCEVLDVQPDQRHLLLMIRSGKEKDKFLCGHDERAWFAAAVPDGASAVKTAMESLKPREVRIAQADKKVKLKKRNKRRNKAFLRQGEWFFVPCLDFDPPDNVVLHNEPIQRGRGKPHMCEQLVRFGGWNPMRRDPEVYVRGRIRHGDHKTVELAVWHRVHQNREIAARGMQHLAFLD